MCLYTKRRKTKPMITITKKKGKQNCALITGAASGIGLACARQFNQQGAAVAGLDINPEIQKYFNVFQLFNVILLPRHRLNFFWVYELKAEKINSGKS